MGQLSKEHLDKLIQLEGEVLYAYDDFAPGKPAGDIVKGTLTAGVGHTGPDVVRGMKVTKQQSREWLIKDVMKFEDLVHNTVKVELTDNQFAALVFFAFNVGPEAFKKSTLLRELNKGNYEAVPKELMKWTKSKGRTLQGLVNRRAAEAGLWAKGSYVSSAKVAAVADVPPVVTAENLSWLTTIVAALATSSATGPIQYALAGLIVVAGFVGGYYFLKRRRA